MEYLTLGSKNSVSLLRHAGGDESHAEAGWASTGGINKDKRKRIPEFLKMLGESVPRHTVPFEHSWLQFQVTSDVATHIQFLKHRTLSINAESARYKELNDDKHYEPQDWSQGGKNELGSECRKAFQRYHSLIERFVDGGMDRKRAKESARFVLPYAHQMTYVISGNFHAYCNFWILRNSEHAQVEVREIAKEMLRLVKEETNGNFTHSLAAWCL